MKKCDFCSEPATVHVTDLSHGKHQVLHLCGSCADKEQVTKFQPQLKVEQIVKSIIGAFAAELTGEAIELACPYCGTKYAEFRVQGRLGCPADYEAFRKGIFPLLQRIHGSTEHKGKCPRRRSSVAGPLADLIRLRRELREAVECEEYEEAVRLRDLIRRKGAERESQ